MTFRYIITFIIFCFSCNLFAQEILMDEEFLDNARGWDVGKERTEDSQIKLGKYSMKNFESDRWHWFAIDLDIDTKKNFLIQSNITMTSGGIGENTLSNSFGLIWGAEDNQNFFAFLVNSLQSNCKAISQFDGNWFSMSNWFKSREINRGYSSNELSIVKYDDDLVFYINGEPLMKKPFQEFYGNQIGFFVGVSMSIVVDNLLVKELPSKETYNSNPSEWSGNGTGFFISKDGYIATNYHVIEDASEIEIEFLRDGKKQNFNAKVIQSDVQNDLSILKIEDSSFNSFSNIPYNFQTSLSDVGSDVFALGYPMALSVMGTEIKFTDGKISSKTGYQGNISTYQMTTPIQPGNSGGPLFDYEGNLVGINSAKIRADMADNVSYAIKSSYLKNLIDVLPESLILPNDRSIMNKELTEQIKLISEYVVLIKVR